jgi:hypothetical protein
MRLHQPFDLGLAFRNGVRQVDELLGQALCQQTSAANDRFVVGQRLCLGNLRQVLVDAFLVKMVEFDGKVLKVKMGGACEGCPLSPSTLHGWVAGTVRQFFPEVERVEEV